MPLLYGILINGPRIIRGADTRIEHLSLSLSLSAPFQARINPIPIHFSIFPLFYYFSFFLSYLVEASSPIFFPSSFFLSFSPSLFSFSLFFPSFRSSRTRDYPHRVASWERPRRLSALINTLALYSPCRERLRQRTVALCSSRRWKLFHTVERHGAGRVHSCGLSLQNQFHLFVNTKGLLFL